MSMQDVAEALQIVGGNPGLADFVGPRDPGLVSAAEKALGRVFPAPYRKFVERLGAGNFGGFEVYGVTTADFESARVPNGVWLTLNERRAGKLPDSMIIIGSTGYGGYYCLKSTPGRDDAVVIFDAGLPPAAQSTEVVAKDFGEYFLAGIRKELADTESDD